MVDCVGLCSGLFRWAWMTDRGVGGIVVQGKMYIHVWVGFLYRYSSFLAYVLVTFAVASFEQRSFDMDHFGPGSYGYLYIRLLIVHVNPDAGFALCGCDSGLPSRDLLYRPLVIVWNIRRVNRYRDDWTSLGKRESPTSCKT